MQHHRHDYGGHHIKGDDYVKEAREGRVGHLLEMDERLGLGLGVFRYHVRSRLSA